MLRDLTLNHLSLVISQAMAPAFLLGALASFISVLVTHMSRIIDRVRVIKAASADSATGTELTASLPDLRLRAVFLSRAISFAVASGISTCLLLIAGFASPYIGVRHEPGVAILFIISLCLFTASLISFAREVRIAWKQPEWN